MYGMATHDFFPSLSLTSETWPLFLLLFCLKAHVMFDFCCQTAFCWLTAFSWAEKKKHHHRIISPRCCRNRCHVLSQVFTLKPKYSTRYHFNFIYKSLKPHTVDLFLFFFPIPANSFRSAECIFNVMVVSPTQTCLWFFWSLVWHGFNI